MQKPIICVCALVLSLEAVMSAPGAFDLQAFEDTDKTADLAAALDADMALMREKRGENSCFSECLSCEMVPTINPSQCVSACQALKKGAVKGQAAKTWTICFMARQLRK